MNRGQLLETARALLDEAEKTIELANFIRDTHPEELKRIKYCIEKIEDLSVSVGDCSHLLRDDIYMTIGPMQFVIK